MSSGIVIGMVVGEDFDHLSKNLPFYGRSPGFDKVAITSSTNEKLLSLLREYGFEVHHKEFTNYSDQRNKLLTAVGPRWLLQLDADERPEPQLLEEVKAVADDEGNRSSILLLPRKNFFMNRLMLHGRQYPDYIPRYFYNEDVHYEGLVHERLVHSKKTKHLKASILHFGDDDISTRLYKVVKYSVSEAKEMTRCPSLPELLVRPAGFFLVSLFRDRAFLDGIPGIVWLIQATICYELKFLIAYYWSYKKRVTYRDAQWNGEALPGGQGMKGEGVLPRGSVGHQGNGR